MSRPEAVPFAFTAETDRFRSNVTLRRARVRRCRRWRVVH